MQVWYVSAAPLIFVNPAAPRTPVAGTWGVHPPPLLHIVLMHHICMSVTVVDDPSGGESSERLHMLEQHELPAVRVTARAHM